MRKLMCDRCGAEIKPYEEFRRVKIETVRNGNGVKSIMDPGVTVIGSEMMELCPRCSRELVGLMAVETSVEVDAPGRVDVTTQIAACCEGCVYCLPSPEEGCYNCARERRRVPEFGRECPWWEPEEAEM